MKYLLIGANGFLGSSLKEQLIKSGNQFYSLPNFTRIQESSSLIKNDLHYRELIRGFINHNIRRSEDICVINASNDYIPKSEEFLTCLERYEKNSVELVSTVIDSLTVLKTNIYFVNFNSYFQYQDSLKGNSSSLYALFKNLVSEILEYLWRTNQIQLLNITLYDTYGAGDNRNKLVNKLLAVSNSSDGKIFEIKQPRNLINISHVDSISSEVFNFIMNLKTGRYSFLAPTFHTVKEFILICQDAWGVTLPIKYYGETDISHKSPWINLESLQHVIDYPDLKIGLSLLYSDLTKRKGLR